MGKNGKKTVSVKEPSIVSPKPRERRLSISLAVPSPPSPVVSSPTRNDDQALPPKRGQQRANSRAPPVSLTTTTTTNSTENMGTSNPISVSRKRRYVPSPPHNDIPSSHRCLDKEEKEPNLPVVVTAETNPSSITVGQPVLLPTTIVSSTSSSSSTTTTANDDVPLIPVSLNPSTIDHNPEHINRTTTNDYGEHRVPTQTLTIHDHNTTHPDGILPTEGMIISPQLSLHTVPDDSKTSVVQVTSSSSTSSVPVLPLVPIQPPPPPASTHSSSLSSNIHDVIKRLITTRTNGTSTLTNTTYDPTNNKGDIRKYSNTNGTATVTTTTNKEISNTTVPYPSRSLLSTTTAAVVPPSSITTHTHTINLPNTAVYRSQTGKDTVLTDGILNSHPYPLPSSVPLPLPQPSAVPNDSSTPKSRSHPPAASSSSTIPAPLAHPIPQMYENYLRLSAVPLLSPDSFETLEFSGNYPYLHTFPFCVHQRPTRDMIRKLPDNAIFEDNSTFKWYIKSRTMRKGDTLYGPDGRLYAIGKHCQLIDTETEHLGSLLLPPPVYMNKNTKADDYIGKKHWYWDRLATMSMIGTIKVPQRTGISMNKEDIPSIIIRDVSTLKHSLGSTGNGNDTNVRYHHHHHQHPQPLTHHHYGAHYHTHPYPSHASSLSGETNSSTAGNDFTNHHHSTNNTSVPFLYNDHVIPFHRDPTTNTVNPFTLAPRFVSVPKSPFLRHSVFVTKENEYNNSLVTKSSKRSRTENTTQNSTVHRSSTTPSNPAVLGTSTTSTVTTPLSNHKHHRSNTTTANTGGTTITITTGEASKKSSKGKSSATPVTTTNTSSKTVTPSVTAVSRPSLPPSTTVRTPTADDGKVEARKEGEKERNNLQEKIFCQICNLSHDAVGCYTNEQHLTKLHNNMSYKDFCTAVRTVFPNDTVLPLSIIASNRVFQDHTSSWKENFDYETSAYGYQRRLLPSWVVKVVHNNDGDIIDIVCADPEKRLRAYELLVHHHEILTVPDISSLTPTRDTKREPPLSPSNSRASFVSSQETTPIVFSSPVSNTRRTSKRLTNTTKNGRGESTEIPTDTIASPSTASVTSVATVTVPAGRAPLPTSMVQAVEKDDGWNKDTSLSTVTNARQTLQSLLSIRSKQTIPSGTNIALPSSPSFFDSASSLSLCQTTIDNNYTASLISGRGASPEDILTLRQHLASSLDGEIFAYTGINTSTFIDPMGTILATAKHLQILPDSLHDLYDTKGFLQRCSDTRSLYLSTSVPTSTSSSLVSRLLQTRYSNPIQRLLDYANTIDPNIIVNLENATASSASASTSVDHSFPRYQATNTVRIPGYTLTTYHSSHKRSPSITLSPSSDDFPILSSSLSSTLPIFPYEKATGTHRGIPTVTTDNRHIIRLLRDIRRDSAVLSSLYTYGATESYLGLHYTRDYKQISLPQIPERLQPCYTAEVAKWTKVTASTVPMSTKEQESAVPKEKSKEVEKIQVSPKAGGTTVTTRSSAERKTVVSPKNDKQTTGATGGKRSKMTNASTRKNSTVPSKISAMDTTETVTPVPLVQPQVGTETTILPPNVSIPLIETQSSSSSAIEATVTTNPSQGKTNTVEPSVVTKPLFLSSSIIVPSTSLCSLPPLSLTSAGTTASTAASAVTTTTTANVYPRKLHSNPLLSTDRNQMKLLQKNIHYRLYNTSGLMSTTTTAKDNEENTDDENDGNDGKNEGTKDNLVILPITNEDDESKPTNMNTATPIHPNAGDTTVKDPCIDNDIPTPANNNSNNPSDSTSVLPSASMDIPHGVPSIHAVVSSIEEVSPSITVASTTTSVSTATNINGTVHDKDNTEKTDTPTAIPTVPKRVSSRLHPSISMNNHNDERKSSSNCGPFDTTTITTVPSLPSSPSTVPLPVSTVPSQPSTVITSTIHIPSTAKQTSNTNTNRKRPLPLPDNSVWNDDGGPSMASNPHGKEFISSLINSKKATSSSSTVTTRPPSALTMNAPKRVTYVSTGVPLTPNILHSNTITPRKRDSRLSALTFADDDDDDDDAHTATKTNNRIDTTIANANAISTMTTTETDDATTTNTTNENTNTMKTPINNNSLHQSTEDVFEFSSEKEEDDDDKQNNSVSSHSPLTGAHSGPRMNISSLLAATSTTQTSGRSLSSSKQRLPSTVPPPSTLATCTGGSQPQTTNFSPNAGRVKIAKGLSSSNPSNPSAGTHGSSSLVSTLSVYEGRPSRRKNVPANSSSSSGATPTVSNRTITHTTPVVQRKDETKTRTNHGSSYSSSSATPNESTTDVHTPVQTRRGGSLATLKPNINSTNTMNISVRNIIASPSTDGGGITSPESMDRSNRTTSKSTTLRSGRVSTGSNNGKHPPQRTPSSPVPTTTNPRTSVSVSTSSSTTIPSTTTTVRSVSNKKNNRGLSTLPTIDHAQYKKNIAQTTGTGTVTNTNSSSHTSRTSNTIITSPSDQRRKLFTATSASKPSPTVTENGHSSKKRRIVVK